MTLSKPIISKEVTIRDVAEAAGVSISLVSFVLNAKRGANGEYLCSASQATAERIVETAARLGYHSNKAASALRSGHNNTIGVIVSDITNLCFSRICREVENLSSEAGYLTVFGSSDDNKKKFCQLVDRFLYFGVDGMIVAACPGSEPWIEKVMERGIPVVLIDRDLPSLKDPAPGRVYMDNNLAGRIAARMLIKRGYRKITLVRYESDIVTLLDREAGFLHEMREKGLGNSASVSLVSKESMAKDILSVISLAKDSGAEALIFPSATITVSGIAAINRLGLSIPDDVAVAGFDLGDASGIFNPHIMFVNQPTNLIAEYSFKMLLSSMNGTAELGTRIVDPLIDSL